MSTDFQAASPQRALKPGIKSHPYATISPGKMPDASSIDAGIADDGHEDPIALVLPSKLASDFLSEDGNVVNVTLHKGVVTWIDDLGMTHQLGDEEDAFNPLASHLLRSDAGLLVLFMDMQTGEHLNWAVFKAQL